MIQFHSNNLLSPSFDITDDRFEAAKWISANQETGGLNDITVENSKNY